MLTVRALNRALLARQLLLDREDVAPKQAIERLLGLQAQSPQSPYVALWSRLLNFDPAEASRLLEKKQLVRLTVMRGTVHLVTAADARTLRPLVQGKLGRGLASGAYGRAIRGLDLDALTARARALVEEEPRTLAALRPLLAEAFPKRDPVALSYAAHFLLPLVQLPPRGLWRGSGQPVCTTLEAWTGKPLAARPDLGAVVLRYLRAFGPATVNDLQAWSGLTKLGAVVARLGKKVCVLRDDEGRTLYDVPGAPLPDADTPAPVRFLPDFDNAILGFADRRRILADADRQPPSANGVSPGAVLIDGFVKASWKFDGAALRVKPFRKLPAAEKNAVLEEGERLARFLGGSSAAI